MVPAKSRCVHEWLNLCYRSVGKDASLQVNASLNAWPQWAHCREARGRGRLLQGRVEVMGDTMIKRGPGWAMTRLSVAIAWAWRARRRRTSACTLVRLGQQPQGSRRKDRPSRLVGRRGDRVHVRLGERMGCREPGANLARRLRVTRLETRAGPGRGSPPSGEC